MSSTIVQFYDLLNNMYITIVNLLALILCTSIVTIAQFLVSVGSTIDGDVVG